MDGNNFMRTKRRLLQNVARGDLSSADKIGGAHATLALGQHAQKRKRRPVPTGKDDLTVLKREHRAGHGVDGALHVRHTRGKNFEQLAVGGVRKGEGNETNL